MSRITLLPAAAVIAALLLFFPLRAASQPPARAKFSLVISNGHPEKIFDGTAEASYEVNAFGVSELAFKGIIGLQIEPTSAFRHHSVSNITRGDNIYIKCADSSLYEGHVDAISPDQIRIDFHPITLADLYQINQDRTTFQRKQFRILAGAVFPLGVFAQTDILNGEAGYANTGICAGGEYTQGINDHIELGLVGLYSHNPLNESILMAQLIELDESASFSSSGWDLVWLLGEAGYTTNILPIMTLYVRGQAGIMGGYAADITQTLLGRKSVVKSGSTITPALGLSAGITESRRVDVSVRLLAANGAFTHGQETHRYPTYMFLFMAGYIF